MLIEVGNCTETKNIPCSSTNIFSYALLPIHINPSIYPSFNSPPTIAWDFDATFFTLQPTKSFSKSDPYLADCVRGIPLTSAFETLLNKRVDSYEATRDTQTESGTVLVRRRHRRRKYKTSSCRFNVEPPLNCQFPKSETCRLLERRDGWRQHPHEQQGNEISIQ